ncbi:hypothetical protein BDZ91DRAFT_722882 [Kalaharituber pfeilii]|nr:hypothetical protein BDZ91DRAFT_722882 [Kalaharituber pfeilii]
MDAPRGWPHVQREIQQEKQQDYEEWVESLVTSSPPEDEHLSGIFSIQIHQAVGLEVQRKRNHSRQLFGSG